MHHYLPLPSHSSMLLYARICRYYNQFKHITQHSSHVYRKMQTPPLWGSGSHVLHPPVTKQCSDPPCGGQAFHDILLPCPTTCPYLASACFAICTSSSALHSVNTWRASCR